MKAKRILTFVAMALVAAALPALAKTYKNSAAGVQYDVPDTWKLVEESDGGHAFSTEDEQALLVMLPIEGKDMNSALDNLGERIEKVVKNAKVVGEPQKQDINGLPTALVEGTGEYNDQPITWSAAVVVNGDKCLIVLAFGTEDGLKKYQAQTVKVFHSIKKT
jgi:hypothetical protein